MKRPSRLALAVTMLTLVVGACGSGPPSSPGVSRSPGVPESTPPGVGRDEAIELARSQVPPTSLESVLRAEARPFRVFGEQARFARPDQRVWRVILRGRFLVGCGPVTSTGDPPSPCPRYTEWARIYLDYATGEFLGASYFGLRS